MTPRTRRRTAAGAIALALVALVACSDDDDATPQTAAQDASTDDGSATATTAATSEADTGAETTADGCPPIDGVTDPVRQFDSAPPMCIDVDATYQAIVGTNLGEFTIDLDPQAAPETTNNFVFLARNRYFDDTVCHRIIPGFVVQCGDPTATGTGDPGYRFADELPAAGEYQVGSIAMANSGPDTNGSQFFIITGDDGAALPPLYSLFGQVGSGFDDTVVEMEAAGTLEGIPASEVRIDSVTIVEP
ncbi:MAG: peptidylprolyl isomerase [Ilumatobacteraceae bacterium]|nr:peptidylprolyl isomerase [Ilumatobacteraceae bacterium]